MNKTHFKLMKIATVKTSLTSEGVRTKLSRGIGLIKLTEIQFIYDSADGLELVMNSGDRFFVENLTLVQIQNFINGIED